MPLHYLVLRFKGKPISKDNEKLISKYPAKKTGRHYMYTSTKYENYEKDLREQAILQLPVGFKPFTENVWVSLFFHFKNKRHGDITNLPKSICDAMQGGRGKEPIVYLNDKQVWLDKVFPIYNKEEPEGFTMVIKPVKPIKYTKKEKLDYIKKHKHPEKFGKLLERFGYKY